MSHLTVCSYHCYAHANEEGIRWKTARGEVEECARATHNERSGEMMVEYGWNVACMSALTSLWMTVLVASRSAAKAACVDDESEDTSPHKRIQLEEAIVTVPVLRWVCGAVFAV